jgi:hypothetical protein
MSNTDLIIPERSSDIGSFIVGRILPFREKRMVGPFIFIDHMGPSTVAPEHYLDVGQHPHIGLSTLTYLFEGEILHRDSIGSVQKITRQRELDDRRQRSCSYRAYSRGIKEWKSASDPWLSDLGGIAGE